MAKQSRSNLPRVISKANRDISTIIDTDIASEAMLLKDLVNQVRDANLEVKKNNNQRITEAKRKLVDLDDQISNLNSSIDLVDRETVIQQLNEMIETENKIFAARQEVRFFDNKKTPDRITTLEGIYNELTSSIEKLNTYEEAFPNEIIESNTLFFDKQLVATTEIVKLMDDLFNSKKDNIINGINSMQSIYNNVKDLEDEFSSYIKSSIDKCYALSETSGSIFSDVDDNVNLGEKIKLEHEAKLVEINSNIEALELKFNTRKDEINEEYIKYEEEVTSSHESINQKVLDEERKAKADIDQKLKSIRLQIINAEKKSNYSKVSKLLKEFEKTEKSASAKFTSKVTQDFTASNRKVHIKSINKLQSVEKKHLTEMNKQEHSLSLEKIKYEEAKILYKIQSDYNALRGDVDINKSKVTNLSDYLDSKVKIGTQIIELKKEIISKELIILKENELIELSLFDTFKEFLIELKRIEKTRVVALKQNLSSYDIIKTEQEYHTNKSIEDIKLDQNLNDIEKLILSRRNETLIKNEKIKEEANSDIIFQESLINIAKKEHELQLIKVQSLYENERNLSEDQIVRINQGVKVNDAFVKTTLENQLLFATQQIKCAQSEYEIRVESINLTLNQELDYANKKGDYYRQKYEYDKAKIRKELDDNLEDLNYKFLLFTDEKDNRIITNKIKKLKASSDKLIEDIEDIEFQDVEILRYDKVIRDASNRAETAINEAAALRDQTTDSFEELYFQTQDKFDLANDPDQIEDGKGIVPLLSDTAVSSANDRLQQAIKEADELYSEKLVDPSKIIEDTKILLENMINSKESDIFIEEHKELKHVKIKEHKEICEKLLEDKNDFLSSINNDTPELEKSQNSKEIPEDDSSFDIKGSKDESKIEKHYQELEAKEVKLHKDQIQTLVQYKLDNEKDLNKISKETNQMIKDTVKSYKKYIKYATKDLTAKKKVLAKDFSKKLNKSQSELDTRFKIVLNEI